MMTATAANPTTNPVARDNPKYMNPCGATSTNVTKAALASSIPPIMNAIMTATLSLASDDAESFRLHAVATINADPIRNPRNPATIG